MTCFKNAGFWDTDDILKNYICAWLAWKTLGLSLILNDLRIRIENEDRKELKQLDIFECLQERWASKPFFENPQIRKPLSSFRYRKSANFFGMPVRKSQIANLYTAQLGLKTVLKVVFLQKTLYCTSFN